MTQKQYDDMTEREESALTVMDTRGAFDLSGTVFIGDVQVYNEETGRAKWVSGEHSRNCYNWENFWRP